MRNYLIVGGILLFAVVGFLVWNRQSSSPTSPSSAPTTEPSQIQTDSINFSNPKKSAHFESNTPSHGATLAAVPINIVIDFNFDLAKPSEIKILKDPSTNSTGSSQADSGQVDYGVGETVIDANKLAMRRNLNSDSPDGLYTVEYNACWPDKSCHDGHFQFAINRSKASNFEDQINQKEVTIKLSQIQFNPQNIRVSKGTKVTWVNDENIDHYVNTDSHPAHTYYPAQNSKLLKQGDNFSLTFDSAGIYPYHCSVHASSMIGTLLVE